MPEFPYSRLRRWPDVEADNLQAHDATDVLLVDRATTLDVPGDEIAVIGDEYGAITLALTDAGRHGIRVHQDLVTGRRALRRNADELGLAGFRAHELDTDLLAGARLVLLQLPKSLAELEEIADAVARWAAPDVVFVAGGRVKHMTLGQNDVLGQSFEHVQAERAERKSRLLVASGPRTVPEQRPFPVSAQHDGLTLVAHGGAFAGARLDIGTRVLLESLGLAGGSARAARGTDAGRVVDLGCGTGALAAAYALAHPQARVTATDRSAAAAASARATMAANGVADHVLVTHDDAGSELPDAAADVVLLNPPFHLGSSVHTGAATRLFEAAARLLRPGGELWTVYNSSLGYRSELNRLVGSTEQLHRTAKFTVTRSIRR
ncbi:MULTISPECIES: class I SAM-dependent methyltransferase [unclassified Microbacterium]|uniref:class I SAM-dependent methyltransferase n=1 Tax=unclassified Microbacterium TaxID=2609290 RepID=UPI000EAA325E|nr:MULTISPECIES: methyltransferase [unclassified Microbacterium]MBT2484200.1 methyltransferase [Microbacterium sp. ISL-108]RKN67135.1 methyltransferase domain-containing protein [Microbacterium sp. CGR2]